MEINEIKQVVKQNLSKKRYDHTIRVYEVALQLAKHYGVCENKVAIAALFHDYCKDEQIERLKQQVIDYDLPPTLLLYDQELWHGPVAAKMVRDIFHIADEEIYRAIYYHTTGRPNMSDVEKIVFIADYIEPNRHFSGIDAVRKAAYENIDEAIALALSNSIAFLQNKQIKIHELSLDAYQYYQTKRK